MHFDQVIDWQRAPDGVFLGEIDESWAQGRTVFGGLVTAAGLRMLRTAAPEREPVELHTRYVGPLPAGEVRGEVRTLRSGKSITHVEARIYGAGELATVVSGTLAVRRESAIRLVGEERPEGLPDPETLVSLPYLPGVTPAFLQHLDMRWTTGGAPFTGQTEPEIGGFCRVAGTSLPGAEVAAALLDVWPTPVLPMLTKPAPASTIAWSGWLHDVPETGEGWWWYRERAHAAADGIAVSVGYLYAPDGRLAATKGQSAAVYG